MGSQFGYLDKFTKKKFMLWKFKMETMLKVKDLRSFIDKKETKPEAKTITTLAAYKKKESYTLNLIGQILSNGQLLTCKKVHCEKHLGCSLNAAHGQGPNQHAILDSKVFQFTNGFERSHGGAFEQVGCHSKRSKGNDVPNEFA